MFRLATLLLTLLLWVNSAFADCVDVSTADRWSLVNSHKIILYRGDEPLALLEIPYCYIYPTSEIRLIRTYICDWDEIIVDNEVCEITEVKRL